LYVAMPRERGKDGRWYELVTIITKEGVELIEKTVLEAYDLYPEVS